MKRPREPSGSDGESDGPIDVGCEGELSQMARPLSTPSPSQMQARKKRRGIIEKRRRDRINSSLSELRRLVPTAFEKQGSSKLEKAEVLQMTVDHLKMLHATGFFDARALAVDFRSIGFRECLTEVISFPRQEPGLSKEHPASTLPLLPSPSSRPVVPVACTAWRAVFPRDGAQRGVLLGFSTRHLCCLVCIRPPEPRLLGQPKAVRLDKNNCEEGQEEGLSEAA